MLWTLERGMREVREKRLVEKIRKIVKEELEKKTKTKSDGVVKKARVGDVRKDWSGVYVVTRIYKDHCSDYFYADLLYESGRVIAGCDVDEIKNDKLLARYDTWREAIASEDI